MRFVIRTNSSHTAPVVCPPSPTPDSDPETRFDRIGPLRFFASEGTRSRAINGFTLVEVLAALLFMAIVIPVAMQGLQIASRAGEVAQRKTEAARVAERILNENIVTTNWTQSSQSGTVVEGTREFRWTLLNQPWSQNTTNQAPAGTAMTGQLASGQPQVSALATSQSTMNLLTVEVVYAVQNRDYSVRLSTLVNSVQ